MRPSYLFCLACAPAAYGQSLEYAFDPAGSDLTLDAAVTLELGGDLRGVFDPDANPTGTRTIAGLLGDPGDNARVPISLDLELDVDLGGALAGGFVLDLDAGLLTAELRDLDATLGSDGGAGLALVLEYDTFRTIAPQSLFLGGFALPIPLGNVDVTGARIVQSAPATAALLPSPAGPLQLAALVPVDLTFDVSLGGLFGDGPFGGDAAAGEDGGGMPVGPIPLMLPIAASVDLADCGASLVAPPNAMTIDESGPSPIPLDLPDVPLDLPTLLPPGGTANLLLDASLSGFSVAGTFSTSLSAEASAASRYLDVCAGDPNSAGAGATMAPLGSPSVSADDFGLQIAGLPSDQFGILVMSRMTDTMPCLDPAQGTLCLGAPCIRFTEEVRSSGPAGEIAFFPDADALPFGTTFSPGERWNFQWWYRDRNPGPTSNLSGALGVRFCR